MTASSEAPALTAVSISGQPVALDPTVGMSGWKWPVQFGVTAPEVVWNLDPGLAATVLAKRETEITIAVPGDGPKTFKRVVVVGEAAPPTPYVRSVVLSDIRWYWRYKWIRSSHNVRRRTGSVRRMTEDPNQPTRVQATVPELVYAVYSLTDAEQAYTADGLVAAILDRLEGAGKWKAAARTGRDLKPQDAVFDDAGQDALGRALAMAGGVDVFVNAEGQVVVTDAHLGAEKHVLERGIPWALDGHGSVKWVTMDKSRGPNTRALFTRSVETRFDFDESIATRDAKSNEPYLENRIKVTDTTLTVNGVDEAQGSLVEVNAFLAAVAADDSAPTPRGVGPLSLETICIYYLGGRLNHSYVWGNGVLIEANEVWAQRIAAVYACFRVTMQINRRFMERVLPGSLKPVRAGLLNAATGQRQPSPVYADYCRKPKLQTMAKMKDRKFGWNVHSFPGSVSSATNLKTYTSTAIKDLSPSPASVDMLDSEVGVFNVAWVRDEEEAQLVPSLVSQVPTDDMERVRNTTAIATWNQARLAASHKVSVIMSCTPAGPNDGRQFHTVDVPFATALRRLGVNRDGQQFDGPTQEIRVMPQTLEARTQWDDDRREEILGAFDPTKAFPSSIRPINEKELIEFAEAVAAVDLAGKLDHYEGTQTLPFHGSWEPIGSLHTVVHQVDPEGGVWTSLNCEPRPAPVSPESLLSTGARKAIFGALS